MKKTNKKATMGMSLGMCFGVALGTSLGQTIFDSMALGSSMGLCLGMAIGMALGSMKDKAVNAQIEEQGYTVKEIVKQDNDESYLVVIADKSGNETKVTVAKGIMDEEAFCVGDIVYLNEEGDIEQAYDKEGE